MKIKVCGMRDAYNVAQVGQLPINYMGFIFYPPSARFVGEDFNEDVPKSVPRTVKKIGVFVNASTEDVLQNARRYNLDGVQLHGTEDPRICEQIKCQGLTIIKTFGIDDNFDFAKVKQYYNACDYLLFDTKSPIHGGTGIKFNWAILRGYDNKLPIFLSGGIAIDDIPSIKEMSWLNIHSLDINSKFELQPGLKDVEKVRAFVSCINEIKA